MTKGARAIAVAMVATVSLAGCSVTHRIDPAAKYRQTWPKEYVATTCVDWQDKMTPAQRFAAAADMLAGARNRGDGGTGLPSDSLIAEFQQGVTTACVIPDANIAEIAATLYLSERERFRP